MNNLLSIFSCFFLCFSVVSAQYVDGNTVKYGNEWIDYSQEYFKFKIAKDGVYRITLSELTEAGFPVNSVQMDDFELYRNGQEVPIFTTGEGIMTGDDFIEFFGTKNRNEIDKYFWEDQTDQLNPKYSIITDSAAYFLSYSNKDHLRYASVQTDLSGNLPPVEQFYIHNEENIYFSTFNKKQTNDLRYSNGQTIEGFGLSFRKTENVKFVPTNIYNNGPDPELNIRFGTNLTAHAIEIKIGNTLLNSFVFQGNKVIAEQFSFSPSLLSSSTTVNITGTDSNSDQFALSEMSLSYPRTFNFSEENRLHYKMDPSPFKRYFQLIDFDVAAGSPVVYDQKNNRRIQTIVEDNVTRFISPASSSGNDFKIYSADNMNAVSSFSKVNFSNFEGLDHDYLILSHEVLFDDGNGTNWVQKYADYRQSSAGGSFNPIVVTPQQIYDQFGYGIDEHFLAVKSFLNWLEQEWSTLDFVFVVGKAREYSAYRTTAQKNTDPSFHVPTFGYPGSDNLLVAEWGQTTPKVPIGRLAAREASEVEAYYNKMVEHEDQINNPQTIEGKLWMKKIMHLSGGDAGIQENIKNYLKAMEIIAENNQFGADVATFYKSSSDPIETVQSQLLINQINDGVSIINFFGHSAVGVFDLNLEDVSEYDNKGKYPLIISLGCHSGNVHTSATGLSQKFVLAGDRGAIGFLAASAQAYINTQNVFGRDFYDAMGSTDYYGKPIGEILQYVFSQRENNPGAGWETLLQQITLHGDPAAKFHSNTTEDYIPDFSSIVVEPEVINAFQESFQLCYEVVNIGKSIVQDLSVNVKHIGPLGTINIDTSYIIAAPMHRSSTCIEIPLQSDDLVGKNEIYVTVDDKDFIVELPEPDAEDNNTLNNGMGGENFDFYILNNAAVPVAPKEFAIYTEKEVTLMASSFNALGDRQAFFLQVDTVETFDSPLKTEIKIEDVTGLISWKPTISFIPGKVYYWRVRPEASEANPGIVWQSSSFLYLPTSNLGWNQSHRDQFEKNEFDELMLNDFDLEFVLDYRAIRVVNRVRDGENFPNFFIGPIFIGFSYYWQLPDPYIAITPFDSLGNFRWNEVEGSYGSYNGQSFPTFTFYFKTNEQESRINLVNFLEDVLETGDHVFLYSIHNQNKGLDFKSEEWAADSISNNGKNIFNVLNKQGAERIDHFRTNPVTPYNFFYRKDKEPMQEGRAADINSTADNTGLVFGRWYTGTETSVKIGPSKKWRKLVWKDESSTVEAHDSSYVRVFGVTQAGKDSLLMDKVFEKEINLSQINPSIFPYLRLQYYTFDNVNKTSPNLRFWRVFYDGQAELALDILDPNALFNADTLDQGQDFVLKIPLKNIGTSNVDSIKVRLLLTDQTNNSVTEIQSLEPIPAGNKSFIDFRVPSKDLSGEYTITLEANYLQNPEECFYFNNFGLRKFFVRGDKRNPLLDVSFDGRRIMNGDIVSAEPIIRIVTKDENRYLLLNDTSTYQIVLVDPSGLERELYFSDPEVIFTPAISGEDNRNEITYTPSLQEDGMYTLKVRSRDMTGNLSGNQDYEVDFQVINEELISNVFNYPNPFSDCTQFIFTLTGNEMPDDISIRIMTVSGKVVKEINGMELGPLHVGVNRTEYKWDGTDEYGSKLANGVYLYQVSSRTQTGDIYDKYDNNTDQYFKNNIGKMVIIR